MNTPDKRVEEIVEEIAWKSEIINKSLWYVNPEHIREALTQHHQDLMSEVVERLKDGVAYGKFGFSRTDEGKNYGKVAINLDDIIKT